MKLWGLFAALAAIGSMVLPAVSVASMATTLPSKQVTILVIITDKGIQVHKFTGVLVNGQIEPGALMGFAGAVPRGDSVRINVFNRGKKDHNFTIFGKKTSPIKPGSDAHLTVIALTRGSFPYMSTLDKGKGFRGKVVVV